jgi:signal transduction histidine kinase
MVDLGTPPLSWFSIPLRIKLVLSTAVILIVACLLLGWLFIQQQVKSAAESLVQSGTLLAQHLAHTGRFSIVAGDSQRLDQLIQEILAVNPVVYAAVIAPNGDCHSGSGKDEWQRQFSSQPSGQRQLSVTRLVRPRYLAAGTNDALVSGIRLDQDGPALRLDVEFTPAELFSLMGGTELPIFYDILAQIPHRRLADIRDPALLLTLEEQLDGHKEPAVLPNQPQTLVQIGLSTTHLQHMLRRLLWQAVLITLGTLAGGLCVVVLLARRITVPLQGLTAAATKLAAGEAAQAVAMRTHDEVGTLTYAFNTMATTLQSREQELRELAHTLEVRVAARTQELAAANAKLQELDRRKSIFVSTASHELRTPLTAMKVHVANLRDGIDGAVNDDQRLSLLRVEANLSRLQTLIDELLDLSQIEMDQTVLHLEPVTLGTLIEKTVEDLHPLTVERRVTIAVSLPPDLPSVSADSDKLRRILLNLLHNAVKFAPSYTAVDVSATRISDDEIRVSVRDVGPGIAQEETDKIFQPFYRTATALKHAKGAGLGLAIAKLLVELHHGRLWVDTATGQGSCFSFTLRAAGSVQQASAPIELPCSSSHQTVQS